MNNGVESTNAHPSNTATDGAAIDSYDVKEIKISRVRQPACYEIRTIPHGPASIDHLLQTVGGFHFVQDT